jgi:hypothetical protein
MSLNNLGTALLRVGERESGTGKLEEAVAAYHEALQAINVAYCCGPDRGGVLELQRTKMK